MGLKEVLLPILLADGGISAAVDDRVYPRRLPEGATLPAISWFRVSTQRIYTYDPYEATDAWATARVQFNCWSRSEEEADRVGEAVLLCLSGYGSTLGGELIGSSFAVNDLDLYDSEVEIFRRVLDFYISYEDSIGRVDGVATPAPVAGTGGA
jgi:hypothetical protein